MPQGLVIASGKTDIDPGKTITGGLDAETFGEGIRFAASAVTQDMATRDLSSLREKVTPECYQAIASQVDRLQPDLQILQEDIILSWVAKVLPEKKILVGTFSFPRAGEVKAMRDEYRAKSRAFTESLANSNLSAMEKKDAMKQFLDENESPEDKIKNSEIITGNFVLARNESGNWMIDGVKLRPAKETMNAISYMRWKGRVMVHLKTGYKISSLLRYDWSTDYLLFVVICAMLTSR